MLNVVFTGPAVNGAGSLILRDNLIKACSAKMVVQKSVTGETNLLVASRTDTVKAKKAAARGVDVMGYPEFLARYLDGVCIETAGKASPWVDKMTDPELLVPCFVDAKTLSALDIL